jgi:hypothetical protein
MTKLFCLKPNKQFLLLAALLFGNYFTEAQEPSLYLKSHVDQRTLLLTSKVAVMENSLVGADIVLYKENAEVSRTKTDANGDFKVLIPINGEYELIVSYPGCNSKKVALNTNGIPADLQKTNFVSTFSIGGFVMSKPLPGVNYSELQKPLVKVMYKTKGGVFEDDRSSTKEGIEIAEKIWEAEQALIKNFCGINKTGDEALLKQECEVAKLNYKKAADLLPGELYPSIQSSKAGECIKTKEEAEKLATEMKAKVEVEEKYVMVIHEGDQAFNKKDCETAKLAYQEALSIRPGAEYPQVKLAEVDKMCNKKPEINTEALVKAQYDATLKMADVFYNKKLYAEAEDAYYEALSFMPNEKYPKDQLVALSKVLARENAGNDKKYQESVAKTGKLNDQNYIQTIKKIYEDALAYESDATHLKRKAEEVEAIKRSERAKLLLTKYPQGITEEIINGNGVVIVKRILIKDNDVWVYQKKIFNWGGVTCFRDDATITEGIFDFETKI